MSNRRQPVGPVIVRRGGVQKRVTPKAPVAPTVKGKGHAHVSATVVPATTGGARVGKTYPASGQITQAELDALMKEHVGGVFKKQIAAARNCWDAGIKIIKNCDHIDPKPQYHIFFEPLAHQKIKFLQNKYPHMEWLGYLIGKVDRENEKVYVEDLIVPKQKASMARVSDVEYSWDEGLPIIGVIHSHHTMGAFFSGTDDEYINQNHDVSIVVSTRSGAEILGQVRVPTACGAYYIVNPTFSINYKTDFDPEAFDKEVDAKVEDDDIAYYQYGIGSGYGYGSLYGGNGSGFRGHLGGGSGGADTYGLYDEVGSIPDDPSDPYDDLPEAELRTRLGRYYSPEEVEEFIQTGEAGEELLIMENLENQYRTGSLVVDEDGADAYWESDEPLNALETELQELESADPWTTAGGTTIVESNEYGEIEFEGEGLEEGWSTEEEEQPETIDKGAI